MARKSTTRKKSATKKRTTRKSSPTAKKPAAKMIRTRRTFSTIDQLPPRIRERVDDMLDDPTTKYEDIIDFVLIETCPSGVQDRASKKLAEAKKQAEAEAQTDGQSDMRPYYNRRRRNIYEWACKQPECKRADKRPHLISDSALSRLFQRADRVAREVLALMEAHGHNLRKADSDTTLATGQIAAAIANMKLLDQVEQAESREDLLELAPLMKACANLFRASVNAEKQRAQSKSLMERAIDHVLARVKQELAKHPDLEDKVAAVVREAMKEGMAQ